MVDQGLIETIRNTLRAEGDPADAQAMQSYMKSETPSYGVRAKRVREIARAAAGKTLSWEDARDSARKLWSTATHREEKHAAIELTGLTRHKKNLVFAELPLFEEMIRTGAWWDYVDKIATHRLRAIFDNDERRMRRTIEAWAQDEDVWIRRSAIICQLLRKEQTDRELLEMCIEVNLGRPEFWLRKAIGWALRHYGRTDPDWVIAFVDKHVGRLSPLSKKEALKHLS